MHRSHQRARPCRARRTPARRAFRGRGRRNGQSGLAKPGLCSIHAKRIGVPNGGCGCSRPWTRLFWCVHAPRGRLRRGGYYQILHNSLGSTSWRPALRIHSPLDRNWACAIRQKADDAVRWQLDRRPRGLAGCVALSTVTGRARPPDACNKRHPLTRGSKFGLTGDTREARPRCQSA